MSTINRGLAEQIISNNVSSAATNAATNTNSANYATSHTTLDFNDNLELYLVRNYDSYVPYFLVFNLFNWTLNQLTVETLNSIYTCLNRIHLTFSIGYRQILQLPFQFLWNLKTPTIVNNKLYLSIPFDMFFGIINMNQLVNNDIKFSIQHINEINNYARNFSLICKMSLTNTFLTGQQQHQPRQINPENIQQLTTLQVNHYNPNVFNMTNGSTEFRIRTDCFDGLTKGLFISCDVDELYEIKFYINNVLRINYDLFFIQNFCTIISSNLLYLPFNETTTSFNGSTSFNERNISSFNGSINFSRINSSILNLQFRTEQSTVCVHNLYYNQIRYQNGMGGLVAEYEPSFIHTDTSIHPLTHIIEAVPVINNDVLDNVIFQTLNIDLSGNYVLTATNAGHNTAAHNNAAHNNAAHNNASDVYPVIITSEMTRQIETAGAICGITHEEILINEHYMQCSRCNHNFSADALKTWLQQKIIWSRTCPMCRSPWSNYVLYINNDELD
jgi:hypothetical protein